MLEMYLFWFLNDTYIECNLFLEMSVSSSFCKSSGSSTKKILKSGSGIQKGSKGGRIYAYFRRWVAE